MSEKFDLDRFGMCEKCMKYADYLIVMDTDDWTGRMCESCNDIYNDNNDYSRGLRKGYEQGQKDTVEQAEKLSYTTSLDSPFVYIEDLKELLEPKTDKPQEGE